MIKKVEYKIVRMAEAQEKGWPDAERHYDSWTENDGLYLFIDDEPVELLGTDGGEPEDQYLLRDWCWVPLALHKAYALGKQHGEALAMEALS